MLSGAALMQEKLESLQVTTTATVKNPKRRQRAPDATATIHRDTKNGPKKGDIVHLRSVGEQMYDVPFFRPGRFAGRDGRAGGDVAGRGLGDGRPARGVEETAAGVSSAGGAGTIGRGELLRMRVRRDHPHCSCFPHFVHPD